MDSNQGYNLYKWVICPLTRVINLHITGIHTISNMGDVYIHDFHPKVSSRFSKLAKGTGIQLGIGGSKVTFRNFRCVDRIISDPGDPRLVVETFVYLRRRIQVCP